MLHLCNIALYLFICNFELMRQCYRAVDQSGEAILRKVVDLIERREIGELPEPNRVELIYSGRNRLYRVQLPEGAFIVKCFAPMGLIRSLYYSYMGKTKAERSHRNALELERRGVGVAKSLGYACFYSTLGLVQRAYYVSVDLGIDSTHLQAHARGWASPEGFMPALAEYIALVHQAGVEHLDLSPGNILYRYTEGKGYDFAMVDLNRMKLHSCPLDESTSLRNLTRLMNTRSTTRRLAYYYALARHWSTQEVINELEMLTDGFWDKRHIKLSYRYARRQYKLSLWGFIKVLYQYRKALRLGDREQAVSIYHLYLQREDIRHIERKRQSFDYTYQDR